MNELVFGKDGKYLESIKWPFKKYAILMPEKNNVDAFAWLFASFVRMYNKKKRNREFEYNSEIENAVKGQIRDNFGNIIDTPTLNKVIEATKTKYLSPDDKNSIKVFNNLFTDKLQVRYIFQDCITGSVVPYFYNEVEVESDLPREVEPTGALYPVRKTKPAKKYVWLAFRRYVHREDYADEELQEVETEFERDELLLKDEDTQLFEDDDFVVKKEDDPSELTDESNVPRKFDIKFLDEGNLVYYDVPVTIEDNRLFVKTPFDISTSAWMNVCFDKGTKENRPLKEISDRLSVRIVSEQKIDRFFEDNKDSIYEKMPNCADLYRTVDSIGDRRLRELVWRLEDYYVRRDPEFFVKCAVILERLLKLIIRTGGFTPSDREFREFADKKTVYRLLEAKCSGIDCYCLKKDELFFKWKRKYVNPNDRYKDNPYENGNWKPRFDFKSDFLDMMIQSDISKSPLMKHDSVNDIWFLWRCRNGQGHDDDNAVQTKVTPDSLRIMKESVNLLSQKINGGVQ